MDDIDLSQGNLKVRVQGLRKTLRALEAAGAASDDMKDLMHDIGMLVVNAAHAPHRTGRLAATVRAGRGKTKAVVRAGGARAPYAGVVHYGWPARAIRPQPFLVEAYLGQRNAVYATLTDGIADLLKKTQLT